MKTIIWMGLALMVVGTAAFADAHPSADDFGKAVAKVLVKSGSFATCSLESREVEEAITAISNNYDGKFTLQVTVRPYGGEGSSSGKACLIVNNK